MKQPPFWKSVCHACAGLAYTVRTQRNARIHVMVAVAVAGLAVWLKLERYSVAILILTIGTVMAAETFNSAIEALVDLVTPEWHELAKAAKDASAGAVLLLSVMAAVVGMLILGPPLWHLLFSAPPGTSLK